MGLCRSYGLVVPWGIWARMWALLSPPLACLGMGSGEELRQLPPVGELDQGLQPQTTCPYPMAVVLAKQEKRKLQGLGPGSCQVRATNTAGKCRASPWGEPTGHLEQSGPAASLLPCMAVKTTSGRSSSLVVSTRLAVATEIRFGDPSTRSSL